MARGPDNGREGTASLLSDVVAGFGRLVQGELMLARVEATQGLQAAGAGLAKIALAAVLGLVGLNVLAGAAVAGLVQAGLGPVWAALVVGLGLCSIGVGLVLAGRAALRLRGLWPDSAARSLRRDAEAVRAAMTEKGVQHV
jgi:hypothetical protein